jgi:hypothetical protein
LNGVKGQQLRTPSPRVNVTTSVPSSPKWIWAIATC